MDVGSPDSGFVATSPASVNSDTELSLDHICLPKMFSAHKNAEKSCPKELTSTSYEFKWTREPKALRNNPLIPTEKKRDDEKFESRKTKFEKCSKRKKVIKKEQVDTVENSPVLGIRILPASHLEGKKVKRTTDSKFQFTNSNNIDSTSKQFVCRLCYQPHKDALSLAQHQCVRIINERYQCPDCGKIYACPANLASHRRWHKPNEATMADTTTDDNQIVSPFQPQQIAKSRNLLSDAIFASNLEKKKKVGHVTIEDKKDKEKILLSGKKAIYPCPICKRRFRRKLNRRKHVAIKHRSKASILSADVGQTNPSKSSLILNEDKKGNELIQQQATVTPDLLYFEKAKNSAYIQAESRKNSFSQTSASGAATLCFATSEKVKEASALRSDTVCDNKQAVEESNQPLDLSLKKTPRSKVFHSINQIMKPTPACSASFYQQSKSPLGHSPYSSQTLSVPQRSSVRSCHYVSSYPVIPVFTQPLFFRFKPEELQHSSDYNNNTRWVTPDIHKL